MDQMNQQVFEYGNTTELEDSPEDNEGASQGVELTQSQPGTVSVLSDGIWGTQPPLDLSLMDIHKIAILTRKIFGTDDLTLFIPKVS